MIIYVIILSLQKESWEKGHCKKVKCKRKNLVYIKGLLFFITICISAGVLFLKFSWYSLTMEEVLFHLKESLKGTDSGIIWKFLITCVMPSVILTVFYVFAGRLGEKNGKTAHKFKITYKILKWTAVIFFLTCITTGCISFHMYSFIRGQCISSEFIDDNYVSPDSVKMEFPKKKRNLIYIYMESMEMTYADKADGGDFDRNVIPELTQMAKQNECFAGKSGKLNGGTAVEDTTWTVAAMFGQTTGLPLKIPMGQNEMVYVDKFFPGVTSLGDILEDE